MAKGKSTASLLGLLFVLVAADLAMAVTDTEFEEAMSALRASGFNLFPNAISTTDLRFRLLTAPPNVSFTLFSPPDPSLFTLDFTSPSAHQYFLALLRHVSPLALGSVDLLNLAQPTGPDDLGLIPTLMPNHTLQLRSTSDSVLSVNGVRVSSVDLYLGQGLAVHGIDRTLMENGSPIPDDYYTYLGSSHEPGSIPEITANINPMEEEAAAAAASPMQQRSIPSYHRPRPRRDHIRRRNRRRRNYYGARDDSQARSVHLQPKPV